LVLVLLSFEKSTNSNTISAFGFGIGIGIVHICALSIWNNLMICDKKRASFLVEVGM
jgi:hypothetical protein